MVLPAYCRFCIVQFRRGILFSARDIGAIAVRYLLNDMEHHWGEREGKIERKRCIHRLIFQMIRKAIYKKEYAAHYATHKHITNVAGKPGHRHTHTHAERCIAASQCVGNSRMRRQQQENSTNYEIMKILTAVTGSRTR